MIHLPVGQELVDAAERGHVESVRTLLANPDLNVNWFDFYISKAALHAASAHRHSEVVRLLLAHPAIKVNLTSGATALLISCQSERLEVIRLL